MSSILLPSPAQDSLGFTLLEVIIAMAIMVLAFTSILAVEGGSVNATARAKQMNLVGMLAKNQMIETEFKIQGKTFTEVPEETHGVFATPYEDYRWETKLKEIKFPKLSFNQKTQDPAQSGGGTTNGDNSDSQMMDLLTRVISSHLSQSLRELTVTVFWTYGTKEQHYSLATYWVNFNHVLTLSE